MLYGMIQSQQYHVPYSVQCTVRLLDKCTVRAEGIVQVDLPSYEGTEKVIKFDIKFHQFQLFFGPL